MSGGKAICYSGAPSKGGQHRLGTPHYSYRFAEEKFLLCFSAMNIDAHFLSMPEFFSSPLSYADLPSYGGRYIHVIFRSTEEIRILKNGYNIVCFAWEFPLIKDETFNDEHPFLNQKRMLSLCDEIWVPCKYTQRVLNAHGLHNVYTIPAAIAIPEQGKLSRSEILARLGHINTKAFMVNFLGSGSTGRGDKSVPLYAAFADPTISSTRKVYLAIFNPEDFRKNLDALIRGFDMFQQRSGCDDLLIIKALTSKDRFDLEQVVRNVMFAKLEPGSAIENENILVFNDLLSADEMTLLYDLADFYVCTSIAEGQNLPLQEAMSRGIVPVTTCNTAMLDYVDADNAVVIATERRINSCEHLAGNIAGKPYEVEICTSKQVAAAFETASALDNSTYAQMSKAARVKIDELYSGKVLQPLIAARLRAISPP